VRFLLDHDIPDNIGRLLRHSGHNVIVLGRAGEAGIVGNINFA